MLTRYKRGGQVIQLRKKPKSKLDQALSIAKSNKKRLRSAMEVATSASVTSTDAFSSTPVVDYIPASGEDLKTRMTSVMVKGTIKRNASSALIDDWRVDFVLDREPNGTEITPLLYLGTATPVIGELRNLTYKERFKILRSEFGSFDEGGNGVGSHAINWYVRLNLMAETKTVNSWTQTNIIKNAVYLVYWTTASANQPIPVLESRVICLDS